MGTKARTTTLVSEEEEETPLRGIFCLKTRQDMKRIEETEDCFILDFDPFDCFDLTRLSISGDNDLAIIHETGQCYCYVCDKPAPCAQWKSSHCNASADSMERKLLIPENESYSNAD
ncbi:unnamed protein product [Arabis nemorensis]|uniref:Uncharacterized protein n=1 Tax=Arabis nemorensis TaxID=586526 RepID=A0A565CR46_9BRAS|nr:unnamed protein product [Arabis nemorensis]